ncbi:cyclic nucleotide-binding domain-containing protein [Thermodesulfobacteriota bacterium]
MQYKKDDLIVKEGNYGITIYEIVSGRVKVFMEDRNTEVTLATLGQKEIFGEMAFLSQGNARRAASVRALEDTTVTVWHPKHLVKEFGQMPPILKLMVEQTLKRLVRVNRQIADLHARRDQEAIKDVSETRGGRERAYRKQTDIPCSYTSAKRRSDKWLEGFVRDISRTGLNLEIPDSNFSIISHLPGDLFVITLTIPPAKKLNLTVKLMYINREGKDNLSLGLSFQRLKEDDKKTLGFYARQGALESKRNKPISFWP